jgi:hypothetical protein
MNITIAHRFVADFDGTHLEDAFRGIDGSTHVVQAHDSDTGYVCALAQAEGQPIAATEQEARYRLAVYIHDHASAA